MRLIGIITFLYSLLSVIASAQPGTFIAYGTKDGLESNHTYDIVEDKDGFIWITSNNGVYRFDGTHFRHFGIGDGLPDNEVLKVSVDRFGRVWFYCFNGRLAYYQQGGIFNERHMPVLQHARLFNFYTNFYEGRNDTYSILEPGGHHIRLKVNADSILSCSKTAYTAIACWEDGPANYYCTKDSIYKDGRPLCGLPFSLYKAYCEAYGNTLFYLRPSGLYCFRGDTQQLLFPITKELCPWKLQVQAPQHFFIGCGKDRVLEVYGVKGATLFSRMYEDVSHPGNAFSDRKGNTWIASRTGGVYYYPRNKHTFRAARHTAAWPGMIITDMNVCGRQVLAGFENGSVAAFDKELALQKVLLNASNPPAAVKGIFYDSVPGRLLVAGREIHAWQADGKGGFRVLPVYTPKYEYPYKDAEMTGAGVLYLINANTLFRLNTASSKLLSDYLFESSSRKFALCPDTLSGKLWYSDMEGLHYLYQGRSRAVGVVHPFLQQRIMDIKVLPGGLLLLSSESAGVAVSDTQGKILQFIGPDALHSRVISKTKLYGNQLWLAGEKGISVYRWERGRFLPVLRINRNTGLLSDNVLSFCLDGHVLYASTTEGLQRLDMQTLVQQTDQPRLFVHSASSKQQTWVNPEGMISLPDKNGELRIECSALAFGTTTPVTFAYRLEGAGGFIEIPGPVFSVPLDFEGSRKLYLRCRKGNSEWSETKTLVLRIPIPFFHRQPVIVSLFLTILLLALLLSNYFMRRIRETKLREQELKLQVVSWELRALQAMMNPHFVFNALNAVQHYIAQQDAYRANKYLAKFSRIIRSNLNSSREPRSILKKELESVAHYLDLEQLRFGDQLVYNIAVAVDVNTDALLIPGMLLQPLAENAVIHGVMLSRHPVLISISCFVSHGSLFIAVRDNGPGLNREPSPGKTHQSLGLEIIRNRLQLMGKTEGRAYTFTLTDNGEKNEGAGATAMLQLPLVYVS